MDKSSNATAPLTSWILGGVIVLTFASAGSFGVGYLKEKYRLSENTANVLTVSCWVVMIIAILMLPNGSSQTAMSASQLPTTNQSA
jgi:hypothetical protein